MRGVWVRLGIWGGTNNVVIQEKGFISAVSCLGQLKELQGGAGGEGGELSKGAAGDWECVSCCTSGKCCA